MDTTRRDTLKCLGLGAGTLFGLSGGIFDFAQIGSAKAAAMPAPLFVQFSDTHIGFNKEANPDVAGTLNRAIDLVNALPNPPAFAIHTGDVTHLSRPAEFESAKALLARLNVADWHVVPGEHDVTDGPGGEFFQRFGTASDNRGYYSFDALGIHFVGLVNVMNFKPGGLGALGDDQFAWLKSDLAGRPASEPVVLFAHMPLWTIYEPWGWGTAESDAIAQLLARFGSVTVLNGHIHQIITRVEGRIAFHTARSTAYPQPAPGVGPGPGPLTVPPQELPHRLGVTEAGPHDNVVALQDLALV